MGRQGSSNDNKSPRHNNEKKNASNPSIAKSFTASLEERLAANPTNYKQFVISFVTSFTMVLILGLIVLVIYPTRVRIKQLEQAAVEAAKQRQQQLLLQQQQRQQELLKQQQQQQQQQQARVMQVDPAKAQDEQHVTFRIHSGFVLGQPFKSCNVGSLHDDKVAAAQTAKTQTAHVAPTGRVALEDVDLFGPNIGDIIVLDPVEATAYQSGRGQLSEQTVWELCSAAMQRRHKFRIQSITWLQTPKMDSNNINEQQTALQQQIQRRENIKQMLEGLQSSQVVSLPVAALITASRDATQIIMDWITQGGKDQVQFLTQEIAQRWIPLHISTVISPEYLFKQRRSQFQVIPTWPVLLIHGEEDGRGKQLAQILQAQARATVRVEIPRGNLYFYEQDPPWGARMFSHKVLDFLELNNIQGA